MRDGSALLGTLTASLGPLGAGGYVTGGEVADDGTAVCRTDTYNGYVRGAADEIWTELIRPGDNISDMLIVADPGGGSEWTRVGTYDIAICATNSNVVYVYCMGYVYKTTDKAVTLTRTAFPRYTGSSMDPNGTYRARGRSLAIDPQNSDVVYFGTADGLRYTTDGGSTWSLVSTSTLPAPTEAQRMLVAFDRSSAVTGGRTQGIYVFCNGTGLYRSTDAGATWSVVSGTPIASAQCLRVHPTNGYVFLTDGSSSNGPLHRWDGTTWIAPSTASLVRSVAISSQNAAHVYAFSASGAMWFSSDTGATFILIPTFHTIPTATRTATDIPWLAWTNEASMTNGDTAFDPSANRIVFFQGIGVWRCTNPPAAATTTPPNWDSWSLGIDQLVVLGTDVTPNGVLTVACMDRPLFTIPRAEAFQRAAKHGPYATAIKYSQGIDWAIDDNGFLVGTIAFGANAMYTSPDSGVTWTAVSPDPNALAGSPSGGNIAVSTTTNWVWLPTQDKHPWYTTDAGANWAPCGIASNNVNGWIDAHNLARRVIVADKENAGTFYAYNSGVSGADLTIAGVYKSTDGGASWTRVCTGQIDGAVSSGADFYHGKLKQEYGSATRFFWSAGNNGFGLFRSTDSCATWARTGNTMGGRYLNEVRAFGFGKARFDSSYPTILVAAYDGTANNAPTGSTYGFWLSYDGGDTFEYLEKWPRNKFDQVLDIAGDPEKYGRWYIGYSGSGVDVIDYDYTMRLS